MVRGTDIRSAELILAETDWLRGLTRKLVRNADLAEDICQDVLVASLSGPGPARGRRRSWMARVARNVAISLARVQKRRDLAEQSARHQSSEPETAELVAELELQRLAVDALSNLHEPYRSALLLRFMKGLSAREAAKRAGVPLETMRARIKRGLTVLRNKLDQNAGGRRGWLAPLGIPGLSAMGNTALWGVVLMKVKTKITIGLGLLLLGLLAVPVVFPSSGETAVMEPGQTLGMTATLPEEPAEAEEPRVPLERDEAEAEPGPSPQPSGSLLARFTWNGTGEPAVDVPVLLERTSDTKLGVRARTDELGEVRFQDVSPGSLALWTAHGFWSERATLGNYISQLAPGEQKTLDLILPEGVDVRGRVVDALGRGVPGAEIMVAPPGVVPQWTFMAKRAEPDGTFALSSVRSAHLVGARAPGYATSSFVMVFTAARSGEEGIDLTLVLPDREARISGTVFGPTGEPVAGAWVVVGEGIKGGQLSFFDGSVGQRPPRRHLQSDDLGGFDVGGLQPGSVPLSVYTPGLAPWQGVAEVAAGETAGLRVDLWPGGVLFGQVTDAAGLPIENASVRVQRVTVPQRSWATTDAAGRYRIEDLPEGQSTVTVSAKDYPRLEQGLTLSRGEERLWNPTLTSGVSIRGVLRDARGEPLGGWIIGREKDRPVDTPRVKTNTRGEFVFHGVEDRSHTLMVFQGTDSNPFSAILVKFEDIRPGERAYELTVPNESIPSTYIEGRAFLPDGSVEAGVDISLYQDSRQVFPVPDTDEEGRFVLGPLPPGKYRVTASVPNLAALHFGELTLLQNQRVDVGDGRMQLIGQLHVKVVAKPEMLADLEVVVMSTVDDRVVERSELIQNGIVFRSIPPGQYRLTVSGPGIETHTETVEVVAMQTRTAEVDLR